jgi:hypothetical protein
LTCQSQFSATGAGSLAVSDIAVIPSRSLDDFSERCSEGAVVVVHPRGRIS